MGKYELNKILYIDFPIIDESLCISPYEISQFLNNPIFSNRYEQAFKNYNIYLSNLSGIPNIGYYSNYMTIDIDEETNESIITFSKYGLILSIMNMLNCSEAEYSYDMVNGNIKKLSRIRTEKELSKEFPTLYKIYIENRKNAIEKKLGHIIYAYEFSKPNFLRFNQLKLEYQKKGLDLEREYINAKSSLDFSTFISSSVKHLKSLLVNLDEISRWLKDNPFEIKLNEEESKKIYLYVLYLEIENVFRHASVGKEKQAQKILIIVEKLIKKYLDTYQDANIAISFKRLLIDLNNKNAENKNKILTINFESLVKSLEILIQKYPNLKRGVEVPNIDRTMKYQDAKEYINNYISSILNDTIIEDIVNGAKELNNIEVDNKINELEEEISSDSLSDKEKNMKRIILAKIKMALIDIKPAHIHTGIGIFSGYYIYFYSNGMVAVDRLNGYGALYVMPIHIYKEARYKKNLTEVRLLPGVKYVNHKKKNWLEDAKNYILNGTDGLSKRDIIEAETIASIDFPYTLEEMEKLEKTLELENHLTPKIKEETAKRKEKIKKMLMIDSELCSQKSESIELSERDFFVEVEELIETGIESFDELYDFWIKKHLDVKIKRNPVVAAITKNRSRDEEGNYHCELCGLKSFSSSSFDSHHMIPLYRGGFDNVYNTVCLCPNCHRGIHNGKVSLYQQYRLFELIRKHLEEAAPEYLEKFDKIISPYASSEEDYKEHKDEIDNNFALLWNGDVHKHK